ncbi:MAG: hypothetical protein IKB76_05030, partial [Kiritimatiellae bacterium]|nr:hypothetical protein [Kiritimatiellia bacterium]
MKAGKCLFVVCAIVIAHVAGGAEIRNVTAKQRYPWNGKVDITYEVVGDVSEGLPVWRRPVLVVSATNRVDGAYYIATVNALTGYTGLDEGTHHLVWDLNKQGLQFRSDDVVFTVAVASVTNGSYDARPMYCVVDLSSGVNASVYPVTFFAAPPAGGFNVDEYKTTKLVMKRLESGSFKMGSSQNVTLTEPFYIGIFEVTQRQY